MSIPWSVLGTPFCVRQECRYDLRGLCEQDEMVVCPECGTRQRFHMPNERDRAIAIRALESLTGLPYVERNDDKPTPRLSFWRWFFRGRTQP